jgi:tetratricopeptide (TPR) repeat protein
MPHLPIEIDDVVRRLRIESANARRAGNVGITRRACRAALALKPDNVDSALELGTLDAQTGSSLEGLPLLRRVTHLAPHHADGQANTGSALLASQKIEAALCTIRRALSLQPDHDGARYNEALAHQHSEDIERAERAYRRVLATHPQHVEASRNLAVCFHSLSRVDSAVQTLRKLTDDHPDRADIRENLALVLLDAGKTDEAFDEFACIAQSRYGLGGAPFPPDSSARHVTPVRLKHDHEQLEHLLSDNLAMDGAGRLRDLYASLLAGVPPGTPAAQPLALDAQQAIALEPWYGRRYARMEAHRQPGGALHPALDLSRVERSYLESRPELVVVDDFLSKPTLVALRRFCLENSFWIRSYGGGYVGSFMEDGFVCPLIAQIADDLRAGMRRVVGPHSLRKVWGFKYDSRLSGINLHADFAAVNVNFWIMPDEANRDLTSGGLIVWDKPAPLTWSFEEYNRSPDQARRFLDEQGAKPIVVPYRANRAVIFNSNLFHETDRIAFKDGYENRRINITLLYGSRS